MQAATTSERTATATGRRVTTAGTEDRNVSLPGGADAARRARAELRNLGSDLDDSLLESLRLVVTELVTNSVRHAAAGSVKLRLVVDPQAVRVEVSDRGPGFTPTRRGADDDREGGWGLFLVERMADRWGVLSADDRTRVWCELDR